MLGSYKTIIENIDSFAGTGGYVVLFCACILFLFVTEKDRVKRALFVYLPLAVLLIFFCPLWVLYFKFSQDAEILYRLLWLIPFGMVIAYALVKLTFMIPGKFKYLSAVAGMVIVALFGSYIYKSPYFSKAENEYHVPDTVVKICKEIEVPGREIRACFPEEFTSYVRQYSATVFLTYGRESYMFGDVDTLGSEAMALLRAPRVDMEALANILREKDTPYLVIRNDRAFTENPWVYDFCFVTEIDGYDIYLDNRAYIGLDYINQR